MILCGMDFFMRLVIIERCHLPQEWFIKSGDEENSATEKQIAAVASTSQYQLPSISTTHTNISSSCYSFYDDFTTNNGSINNQETKPKVTLKRLLQQPRLLVSLNLTVVVAAAMSAFEVNSQ